MDNLAKKRLTNCCGQLDTRQKMVHLAKSSVVIS